MARNVVRQIWKATRRCFSAEEKIRIGCTKTPPGHTVRVERGAEFVLFSPQAEDTPVIDHINSKLG